MSRTIDLAIFGAGVGAKKALPAIETIFPSVAICHLDAETDERFRSFVSFSNLENLSKENKIKGCYIATPTNTHLELTKLCVEQGIPTLVEKPLALNYQDAVTLASFNADLTAVAFKRRYSRAIQRIRKLRYKADNPFGHLDIIWHAPYPGRGHWKIDKRISGGGILYDIGTHVLDMMSFAIGKISHITVINKKFDKVSETESMVLANVQFLCGATGSFLIAWAEGEEIQKIEYYSQSSRVSWTKAGITDKAQMFHIEGDEANFETPSTIEEYQMLFSEFKNFCQGNRSGAPEASAGVDNMKLIEQVEGFLKPNDKS